MGPADLIEALEKADGPDRGLDARLFCLLFDEPDRTAKLALDTAAIIYGPGYEAKQADIPVYTASFDAALALVEEKLPGWGYYLRRDADGCGAGLVPAGLSHVTLAHCNATTPAIALLIALLRALEAK